MDWFKFHTIWSEGLQELSDAEAGRFIKSICEYVETGEIQAQAGNERYMLSMALKQMKQDAERSAKISGVRTEAGRAGGQSKAKQMLANASKSEQNVANLANATLKNKELRNKNTEKEKDTLNCAEAQLNQTHAQESAEKAKAKAEKPTLTPDDAAWWNPFGEKKELAMAFYRETKLYPMNGEWGHWQKDLDKFVEAGIDVELMIRAIRRIQAEGRISYKTPGSVLSTARWLKSQQEVPVQGQSGVNQASPRRLSAVEVIELMENQAPPEGDA